MKYRKFLYPLLVLVLLASSTIACGISPKKAAEKVIDKYEDLITAYQDGRRHTADGRNCVITEYGNIDIQMGLAIASLEGQVAYAGEYREALKDYGTKVSEEWNDTYNTLNKDLAVYTDEAGNPIPTEELDLAKLAEQGALPTQMGLTLKAFVTSFTEAPMPPMDMSAIHDAQVVAAQAFNHVNACTRDVNEAIFRYNTERKYVSGDVVGTIADYLGVAELPMELPYFELEGSMALPEPPKFDPGE